MAVTEHPIDLAGQVAVVTGAGSESGMGAFVNDITPEDAAARLRAVEL